MPAPTEIPLDMTQAVDLIPNAAWWTHARSLIERGRQVAKWGVQEHPWRDVAPADAVFEYLDVVTADQAKKRVDTDAKAGNITYAAILVEEVAEALEAETPGEVVAELVQVIAVCSAAIEAIERNGR